MTEVAAEPTTYQLFIAGRWVSGVTGETFGSVNPADTRDIVGRFQAGTPADVAMAIRAAEMATPAWKATPAPKSRACSPFVSWVMLTNMAAIR